MDSDHESLQNGELFMEGFNVRPVGGRLKTLDSVLQDLAEPGGMVGWMIWIGLF